MTGPHQQEARFVELTEGYRVWTKRLGSGGVPLLTLHGGPGFSHEIFSGLAQHLPDEGIDIILYDQLGSHNSDKPDDVDLWTIPRFTHEVEQVRAALGLEEFYLLGLSWGGILGIEYALAYPGRLKGLIVSSMTASIASYEASVNALRDKLPPDVRAALEAFESAGATHDPAYLQLIDEHLNRRHICRADPWPEAVTRMFETANQQVYETMQGPNEFVVTGSLAQWNRWDDLARIAIPTELIVGRHDTVSVKDAQRMAQAMPAASATVCEQGSHFAMWDDPAAYRDAVVGFIRETEERQHAFCLSTESALRCRHPRQLVTPPV